VLHGVVVGAGDLGKDVETGGTAVVAGLRKSFGVVTAELLRLQLADGGVDGERVAIGRGERGVAAAD